MTSKLRVEISKLHKKLKSNIVYVTHDQVEAMTLADKIVIMNKGNIEQFDTPEDIYTEPKNIFVAMQNSYLCAQNTFLGAFSVLGAERAEIRFCVNLVPKTCPDAYVFFCLALGVE